MCGILGVFNLDGSPINIENCFSMLEKIKHRGPDGQGKYVNENIALMHRRLAILRSI